MHQHAPRASIIASNYDRLSTDRETAQKYNLEWVTPGHPLFEALRRHSLELGRQQHWASGACFHSLQHQEPARLDFYQARVVDGLDKTVHERLFVVELAHDGAPRLVGPDILGNLTPTMPPVVLPAVAERPEATEWLYVQALRPFLEETRAERTCQVQRIADHVELSLTELLARADAKVGHASEDKERGSTGAAGRLAQAENRHDELSARRVRRRAELDHQRAVSLHMERITTVLALPHPARETPAIGNLRPNAKTEMTAMRVVMNYEEARGCQVDDVHAQNLGYDVTSLDLKSGELRLIEIKGLAAASGNILLTPNERRVAEDRPECYWLYVVTNCADVPQLQEPVANPAQFSWHEESKVQHYWLHVDAMTQPMRIRDEQAIYGV